MLLISISFISIITILMKGKRAFIIEKQLLHLAQTNPPVIQCRCKVKWILSLQVYLDSFWAESKLNLCLNGREKIYCNFWMNIFLLFTEGKMIHINLVFKMMSSTFFVTMYCLIQFQSWYMEHKDTGDWIMYLQSCYNSAYWDIIPGRIPLSPQLRNWASRLVDHRIYRGVNQVY